MRLVMQRLPGACSCSSMSTLRYSRLSAFSLSQISHFFKTFYFLLRLEKSLRGIRDGIAYMLFS